MAEMETIRWSVAQIQEESMTMHTPRWQVAQIFSKRAHLIQDELERSNRGVAMPIYKRRWFVEGEKQVKDRPIIPGYLFVEHNGEPVGEVEGIIRILPGFVNEYEKARLEIACIAGDHNVMTAPPQPLAQEDRQYKRLRSRPSKRARPGKHIRARMRLERERAQS